jgi:hypothetical protein
MLKTTQLQAKVADFPTEQEAVDWLLAGAQSSRTARTQLEQEPRI